MNTPAETSEPSEGLGRERTVRAAGVGHSDGRTPAKHAFLNGLVGRFVAAAHHCAERLGMPIERIWLFDLTAGDGIPYGDAGAKGIWHYDCSPGILAHHGRYDRCPVPVEINLYEIRAAQFNDLQRILHLEAPPLGYAKEGESEWSAYDGRVVLRAHHGDGGQAPLHQLGWGDFVFLNHDPNHIADWALTPIYGVGSNVLSLTTMGCNVGGLLRLPLNERSNWVRRVAEVVATLSVTQDALLISIDGDGSRWGYLATSARKWWETDGKKATKAFGDRGFTITSAWWRRDPQRFEAILGYLMLSAADRDQGARVDLQRGTVIHP